MSKRNRITGIIMLVIVIAEAITMFAFPVQYASIGQRLLYVMSGGTVSNIYAPTLVSTLIMAVLMVLFMLSVKTVVEGLYSLFRLDPDKHGTIVTCVILAVCYLVMLLCFMMIPCLRTSAWLGAIIVVVAMVIIYFVLPNGDTVSLVPVFRRHAKSVDVIADVIDGKSGIIVETEGERADVIEALTSMGTTNNPVGVAEYHGEMHPDVSESVETRPVDDEEE